MFPTCQCLQKIVQNFFYFVKNSSYLPKSRNTWFLHTYRYKIYHLRSKENQKNPEHSFVDIGKMETCAKFQQKILSSMVVGARQNFQFFREITWFLGNGRALSTIKYWILHHLINIVKLQNH